jgi:hypothetical protein
MISPLTTSPGLLEVALRVLVIFTKMPVFGPDMSILSVAVPWPKADDG